MHPDGTRVAFTVTRIDIEADRYVSEISLWDGQRTRAFTHGPGDRSPRWSPDGARLAFIRKGDEDGARPQLAVMSTDGGEALVLTDVPLGVEDLEWSPDGQRIAVVGVTWIEELADLDDEERSRRPRRIDRLAWRADNDGWRHDRRRHIYVVDPDGQHDTSLLTPGDFDDTNPRWRPDGAAIAFLSARHDERDLDPGNQPFLVDLEGGEPRPLAPVGGWEGLSWRPDGVLHLVGLEDAWAFPDVGRVWRSEEAGRTDLTGHLDRDIAPFAPAVSPSGPQWIGEEFVICAEDAGRVRVISVAPDATTEDLIGGDRCVTGASPRADGTAIAFVATTPTYPGELYWWEDGEERVLTDLNAAFRDEVALVAPEPFSYDSDGVSIQGWAYLPPGDGQVPLLLNIHGGPASQFGWYFFDEFQVYAGAGYGVVAVNPRGSSGRGRDFVRAVVGRWAEDDPPDMRDLRGAVDAALERFPRLDGGRLGVMGGSYGGFATARILAADGRFDSGIVERGLLSWLSFAGTSDIGAFFDVMYLGAQLPDGFEQLWRASPLRTAHRITTPTLVIHSESDFRTPMEQGEQLFAVLRRHGVTTEFVRFPDESHELSRSGSPKHRVERFDLVLDWHARHLLGT